MTIKGYQCIDANCPKRFCWSPGRYEHSGFGGAGRRNTGHYTLTCMENAYRGCPYPIPQIDETEVEYYARIGKEALE